MSASDPTLLELAELARPIDDDDWGSERQVKAINAFGLALREVLTEADWEIYCDYALKALDEEALAFGLELASDEVQA